MSRRKSAFALAQASVNGKPMWPRRLLFEPFSTLAALVAVHSALKARPFPPYARLSVPLAVCLISSFPFHHQTA
jgi:hypothetical protein